MHEPLHGWGPCFEGYFYLIQILVLRFFHLVMIMTLILPLCSPTCLQVGNIALDGLSSNKYYAFVRLMGRAASNIALEVALQTHPTICLLGEEVAARHQNLASIAEEIASVVAERAAEGKNQGVILVPEGLIEVSEHRVCVSAL